MWQPGSPRDEPKSFITIGRRILNKCDIPEAEVFFENKTHRKSPRMRSPLDVCQVDWAFVSSLTLTPGEPLGGIGGKWRSPETLVWSLIWPAMIRLRGPFTVSVEKGSTRVIHGFVGKNFQTLITSYPYTALLGGSSRCTWFPTNSTLDFLTIFAFRTYPHLLTLLLLLECSALAMPFWLLLALLQASDHMPFPSHESSLLLSRRSFGVIFGPASVSPGLSRDGHFESQLPSTMTKASISGLWWESVLGTDRCLEILLYFLLFSSSFKVLFLLLYLPWNLFEIQREIAFLKLYLFIRCLSIFRSSLLAIYFMDEKWDGESRWLRMETERPEFFWHLFSLESFYFNFICSFKPGWPFMWLWPDLPGQSFGHPIFIQ